MSKMSEQVPSIEMFEALVATVNNLSAQLAYTNKELSALRSKVNVNYNSNRSSLLTSKPDYSRVSNAPIPGLDPWRNYHGQ